MRRIAAVLMLLVLVLVVPTMSAAQSAPASASLTVPRLIHITGVFQPVDGQPLANVEVVTVSIYADADGGLPVWQERQSVAVEKTTGRFTLLLGASYPDGIPADVFGAGQAQWMSLLFERLGEVEQPRVRIASVPYALKASDAETLGGLPASAYLRAPNGDSASNGVAASDTSLAVTSMDAPGSEALVLPGTTNFLAKYVNGADVGNSAVFETPTATVPTGAVGIGTTTPADVLHLRFNNTNGAITGLAVQNLGNTAASFSGMLFYDQNGALGQFQGFNNVTHEYRINNIASSGSINFMLGTSRFFVGNNGIGVGTVAPAANLEVSNGITGTGTGNIYGTAYTANSFSPLFVGRKARGTGAAPTATQANDQLAFFGGLGYGATGFGAQASGMSVRSSQAWTDAAQGTLLQFSTTSSGATVPATRLVVSNNGNIGIGTTAPSALLEVSNAVPGGPANMWMTSYTNAFGPYYMARRARGTPAAPTAVQNGDGLAGFAGQGYGATGFGGLNSGIFIEAAENFTDTAQGTRIQFMTTALGSTFPSLNRMILGPSGYLGLGTVSPDAVVDVVRQDDSADFRATNYGGGDPKMTARKARGTMAAPSAVQTGDQLGFFDMTGYGTTDWGDGGAAIAAFAAENWTDTANGTAVALFATPLGSTESEANVVVLPGGNVGIGVFNAIPTIPDKLQVFGDIRIGTTGTNGCIRNFAGTGILGTCASDRRFKKDITPFTAVLNQLTALQPVHYFWRAADFPQQNFGDSRAYGLIAQDVEAVLPELVVTGEDGFKAVDYTKLPLLTIQAVKELKAENDDAIKELKAEKEALKQRVDELERLVTKILATTAQR